MKKCWLCLLALLVCACFALAGCNEEAPLPTPDPAPVDPAPVDPAPVDPAPVDPDPVNPDPVNPDPVDPDPVDPDPVDPTPEKKTITGVTLPDKTVSYTGTAQALSLAGTLPQGVSVAFTYNGEALSGVTDAGTYTVRATLSGENYETLELTATLTVTPAGLSGITLAGKSVVYTGTAQTLSLAGTLPQGVSVAFTYNGEALSGVSDAGTYTVRATLSGENYETLELTATLTVTPAEIPLSGIAFEGLAVNYKEGEIRSLTVSGTETLPAGVTVAYTYNGQAVNGVTEEGEYTVVATFSGKNYITATRTAKLVIKKAASVANIAKTVTDSFGKAPDPWAFLPEGMALEKHIYNGAAPDYAAGAAVSALPRMGVGRQLHVLYAPLAQSESALSYVNTLYGGFSAIAGLYQDYINKNPDNYAVFEGTWNVFAFRIEVTEEEYLLMAKAGVVHIELHHKTKTRETYGRVDIADKLALKYEADDNRLNLAFQAVGVRTTQIEFVRDNDIVTGYLYETTGVGDKRLTTSSILTVTADYTIAVGNSGDFIVPGRGVNVEVYSSKTGRLLGTEVYENVTYAGVGAEYDTLWFNLFDISGIDSVATATDADGKTVIRINGAATAFVPEYNKKFGVKTSRQYDIEFKTLYYYAYDVDSGEYTLTSMEIPMLFVQRPNLNTYLSDMKKNNGWSFTPVNTTNAADNAVIAAAYTTYKDVYLKMKDALSYEDTLAWIGTANPWFSKDKEE